jgi:adenylate cyclase
MDRHVFVARERELEQLDGFLAHALAGHGQVCFVTGEAGSGKTALVTEFARRAQEQHQDLIVAVGQSDAHTGAGDPYLPFREVLSQLTGDVEEELAQQTITQENANRLTKFLNLSVRALVELGPDLIGIFVPGAGLAMRVGAFVSERAGWLDKLEQLTRQPRRSVVPGGAGVVGTGQEADAIAVTHAPERGPLIWLRRIITSRFNDGELRTLCFDLGVAYDDLPGEGKADKARELIAYLERRERIPELISVGKELRPDISWEDACRAAGPERSPGIEQSHILEQYTKVLKALAEQRPLMLVLDDLQWADEASVGLLFHLGRRIEGSQVLIVGTYRPDEVALGRAGQRHPLEKVLAEFKRHLGDVWVDLDQVGETERQRFAGALLDTEPNRLDEGFRQALYQHTGGHPLFTVELLRDMQERGDIVQDEQGRWMEGPVLNWAELPARVEGVIEERIGRLEEEMRKALTVASVQGEDFIAEAVARVQAMELRPFIRRLSEDLGKQQRLVNTRGVRRLNAQRLSLYRFRHNLFQKYLYGNLDEVERVYLHEDVGNALEELYGDHVDEIVVQLARHFTEAGITRKAVDYLRWAGEQAADQFANTEALNYFDRALELVAEADHAKRYGLLLARERVYDVQGAREPQSEDLAALEELARASANDSWKVEVALRRANYAVATGDYSAAITAAQEAIHLAQTTQAIDLEAMGHLCWGTTLWQQGEYDEAGAQIGQALALAEAMQLRRLEADSLRGLGLVRRKQGDYTEAKTYYARALAIYRELGDRRGEGETLETRGIVSMNQADYAEAEVDFRQALRIYRDIGDRQGEGIILNVIGFTSGYQGNYTQARSHHAQALTICRDIDDRQQEAEALNGLGLVSIFLGDFDSANTFLEQALCIRREIGDQRGQCWVLGNLSQLSNRLGNNEAAREYSQEALRTTEEIGAFPVQGYALTFLGHALVGLGQLAEAATVYQRAVDLRRRLRQHAKVIESLAGLAHVSLLQGDLVLAQTHAEEILSYFQDSVVDGTDDPFRICLTCYRILQANRDPRAEGVLATAHQLLQERAAKISDEELRRSFLERVPANREIVNEFRNSRIREK